MVQQQGERPFRLVDRSTYPPVVGRQDRRDRKERSDGLVKRLT